jgi:hypothetical protein
MGQQSKIRMQDSKVKIIGGRSVRASKIRERQQASRRSASVPSPVGRQVR